MRSIGSIALLGGLLGALLGACVADLNPPAEQPYLDVSPRARVDFAAVDRPALVLPLAAYPAADTSWNGAFFFRAGRVTAQADIQWVATRQVIVVQPFDPLRPDLLWTLEAGDTPIRTRDGREVRLPDAGFPLDQTAALPTVPDPRPFEAESAQEIVALLQRRCGSCHTEDGVLTPLTEESLSGFSRHSDGLRIVMPFRTEASVLMQRILPDYPLDGAQQTMPPPWSEAPSLTADEIRQIEAWIMLGAPR